MRSWKRWGAGARIAARKLAARAVQVLTTEPGDSPDAGAKTEARALAAEAADLGAGVLKVAQVAGYLDGFDLDDDARAQLAALWDRAPAMSPEAAAEVVAADLGAPPETLFARWDPVPLASASLGQVHAATDDDGREWAVKVQYPAVADALRGDLEARSLVGRLAGADIGKRLDADAVDRLRGAVLRELDYGAEADAQERFAAALAGDPGVIVPEVWRDRSSARVLTMARIHGATIAETAAGDLDRRRQAADIILRFAWVAPLGHGLIHADPNPGNYLVVDAPTRVAFLDFGCTAELEPAQRERERALWGALLHHDSFTAAERFRLEIDRAGLVRDPTVMFQEPYREWERLVTAPYTDPVRFSWSRAYAAALIEATRSLIFAGVLRLPGPLLLAWRQRLGVAAVLGLLDADVDARAALAAAVA